MKTGRDFNESKMCAGESAVMSILASVGRSALTDWGGLTEA